MKNSLERVGFGMMILLGAYALMITVGLLGVWQSARAGSDTPRGPLIFGVDVDDLYAVYDRDGYVHLEEVETVAYDDNGNAVPMILAHYEWSPFIGKSLLPAGKMPDLLGFENVGDPASWEGVTVVDYLRAIGVNP